MCEIWTMGEMLVEIMRPRSDMELFEAGEFVGPFPSGAPAIFIDTVARLGHTSRNLRLCGCFWPICMPIQAKNCCLWDRNLPSL